MTYTKPNHTEFFAKIAFKARLANALKLVKGRDKVLVTGHMAETQTRINTLNLRG